MADLVPDAPTRAAIAVDDLEMVTDALAARAMPFRGVERSQALTQGKRDALAERIRAAAREAYRAAIAIETGLDVTAGDFTQDVWFSGNGPA
jgi:hypothetical protein